MGLAKQREGVKAVPLPRHRLGRQTYYGLPSLLPRQKAVAKAGE